VKIAFRQSGGFTGLIRAAEVDTTTLPHAEAERLEGIAKELSGRRRAPSADSPRGRDLGVYEITIETPRGVRRLSFDDATMPEEAQPLLEFLQKRAGPASPE
jgi:hypothetical protein